MCRWTDLVEFLQVVHTRQIKVAAERRPPHIFEKHSPLMRLHLGFDDHFHRPFCKQAACRNNSSRKYWKMR